MLQAYKGNNCASMVANALENGISNSKQCKLHIHEIDEVFMERSVSRELDGRKVRAELK